MEWLCIIFKVILIIKNKWKSYGFWRIGRRCKEQYDACRMWILFTKQNESDAEIWTANAKNNKLFYSYNLKWIKEKQEEKRFAFSRANHAHKEQLNMTTFKLLNTKIMLYFFCRTFDVCWYFFAFFIFILNNSEMLWIAYAYTHEQSHYLISHTAAFNANQI